MEMKRKEREIIKKTEGQKGRDDVSYEMDEGNSNISVKLIHFYF